MLLARRDFKRSGLQRPERFIYTHRWVPRRRQPQDGNDHFDRSAGRTGAVGCAGITTLTQSSITIALIVLAHRRLDLSGHQLSWWRLIVFIGAYALSAWGLEQLLNLAWWIELMILGSWGLMLAFGLKVLQFPRLNQALQAS